MMEEIEKAFEEYWMNEFEYTPGEGVFEAIKKAYLAGAKSMEASLKQKEGELASQKEICASTAQAYDELKVWYEGRLAKAQAYIKKLESVCKDYYSLTNSDGK